MLNIVDLRHINVVTFRKMCKIRGIKKYTGCKKEWMFEKINLDISSRKIQNFWRRRFYKDAIDSISFDDVYYPCFIYKPLENKIYFYRLDTIIPYIIKTGDVRDPCTRIPYTDNELKSLDRLAKNHGYKYKSTFKIKGNSNYVRRIQERQNIVSTLEFRLSEISQNITHILENNIFEWEDNGPFTLHNITYTNFRMFIAENLTEYRIRLRSLHRYDSDSAIRIHESTIEKIERAKEYPQWTESPTFPTNWLSLKRIIEQVNFNV
jgi:hypothetical protein